ncbi:MAG: hypothetical protein WB561_18675 [Terracidiphilus sp.]
MKPEGYVEIYRVAFDVANSELTEIGAEVERLRIRKEHIEKLVDVLKPLVAEEERVVVGQISAEAAPREETKPATEAKAEPNGGQEAFVADPFQRRIDHVLGIGAGIRDVRKYSRQF